MELFGFRVNDKVLQMRKGSSTLDCNGGNWEGISDDVEITGLNFLLDTNPALVVDADASTGTKTIRIRKITITLSGRLLADPDVSHSISETVRVRNDKF